MMFLMFLLFNAPRVAQNVSRVPSNVSHVLHGFFRTFPFSCPLVQSFPETLRKLGTLREPFSTCSAIKNAKRKAREEIERPERGSKMLRRERKC